MARADCSLRPADLLPPGFIPTPSSTPPTPPPSSRRCRRGCPPSGGRRRLCLGGSNQRAWEAAKPHHGALLVPKLNTPLPWFPANRSNCGRRNTKPGVPERKPFNGVNLTRSVGPPHISLTLWKRRCCSGHFRRVASDNLTTAHLHIPVRKGAFHPKWHIFGRFQKHTLALIVRSPKS